MYGVFKMLFQAEGVCAVTSTGSNSHLVWIRLGSKVVYVWGCGIGRGKIY